MSSRSMVSKWLQKNCPSLVSQLKAHAPEKPVFVVHKVDGSETPTTRIFLRQKNVSSLDLHPRFDMMLADATDGGRKELLRTLTMRTESLFASQGAVFSAPASVAKSLRYNDAATGGTMLERLKFTPGFTAIPNFVGPVGDFPNSPADVATRLWLTKLGFRNLSGFSPVTTGFSRLSVSPAMTKVLAESQGSKVIFIVWGDSTGSPTSQCIYFTADAWDTSVRSATIAYTTVNGKNTSQVQSGVLTNMVMTNEAPADPNIRLVDLDATTLALIDLIAMLNPSKAAVTESADKLLNASFLLGTGQLDDYWIPLVSIGRDQDYVVRSPVADTSVAYDAGLEYDVVTVTFSNCDVIGGVPVAWYAGYLDEAIQKGAANKAELEASKKLLLEEEGKVITYCELSKAVMLPENIVELTTLYADYKKAKEKACEENDFMSKEFTTGVTYGQVQTTINGSRNTRVFYGYRDGSNTPGFDFSSTASMVGWTLSLGSATVVVRDAQGRFQPGITKENAGLLTAYVSAGASVSGGTVDSQYVLWGIPLADVVSVKEGLSDMSFRVSVAGQQGTPSAVYDFNWASVGVSGFPDYSSLDLQSRYRMAMVSKVVLKSIGPKLRKIQLDSIATSKVVADLM